MNSTTISKWTKGCLIVAALVSAPVVLAAPQTDSPEMQRALAKAKQGPTVLRRYITRTQNIYMLDFNEVMAVLYPEQMAADAPTVVAQNTVRQ